MLTNLILSTPTAAYQSDQSVCPVTHQPTVAAAGVTRRNGGIKESNSLLTKIDFVLIIVAHKGISRRIEARPKSQNVTVLLLVLVLWRCPQIMFRLMQLHRRRCCIAHPNCNMEPLTIFSSFARELECEDVATKPEWQYYFAPVVQFSALPNHKSE